MSAAVGTGSASPSIEQVRSWLEDIPDPEIPVISLVDLGVIREVRWRGDTLCVAITPTYSGCPATSVIQFEVERALRDHGIDKLSLERRLSPPWTTDWISDKGRAALEEYGIAPPISGTAGCGAAGLDVACPRCGSQRTSEVSRFGSTPCKAQYRCQECLEPFDYFKCH